MIALIIVGVLFGTLITSIITYIVIYTVLMAKGRPTILPASESINGDYKNLYSLVKTFIARLVLNDLIAKGKDDKGNYNLFLSWNEHLVKQVSVYSIKFMETITGSHYRILKNTFGSRLEEIVCDMIMIYLEEIYIRFYETYHNDPIKAGQLIIVDLNRVVKNYYDPHDASKYDIYDEDI